MTTIVMNLRNGAVTEYDEGVVLGASDAYLARADGLHLLGGALDGAAAIAASFSSGSLSEADAGKRSAVEAFLTVEGPGPYFVEVTTVEGESYAYPVEAQRGNERRAPFGLGLYSSHWQFGFRNGAGADFRLEQMNPKFVTVSRRI